MTATHSPFSPFQFDVRFQILPKSETIERAAHLYSHRIFSNTETENMVITQFGLRDNGVKEPAVMNETH